MPTFYFIIKGCGIQEDSFYNSKPVQKSRNSQIWAHTWFVCYLNFYQNFYTQIQMCWPGTPRNQMSIKQIL